ncbi:hypothetical protein JYU34_006866 [Plutella xylostella]|uniref:Uncharacterized protein n=1 Tax=Plutella xylostella TaxID=51655 RepID=A0ABQ7QT14_PLUXY|nr:hypothetical protein JYU34_006866 [Plutella xylostella]
MFLRFDFAIGPLKPSNLQLEAHYTSSPPSCEVHINYCRREPRCQSHALAISSRHGPDDAPIRCVLLRHIGAGSGRSMAETGRVSTAAACVGRFGPIIADCPLHSLLFYTGPKELCVIRANNIWIGPPGYTIQGVEEE